MIIDLPHDYCFPFDKRNNSINSVLFDKIYNIEI